MIENYVNQINENKSENQNLKNDLLQKEELMTRLIERLIPKGVEFDTFGSI